MIKKKILTARLTVGGWSPHRSLGEEHGGLQPFYPVIFFSPVAVGLFQGIAARKAFHAPTHGSLCCDNIYSGGDGTLPLYPISVGSAMEKLQQCL